MRVVILGCGYLGTALARALRAEGHPVSALTRNRDRVMELGALGVVPIVCADLAGDAWHGELDPTDAAVVNCVSPASPSPEGYRHSFITGTKSLVSWLEKSVVARHAPARELLFTSATSVYPQTDGGWVGEEDAFDAAMLSPAGAILREAESLFLVTPTALTRRRWVLRLAGIYGPDRHQLLDKLRSGSGALTENADHWLNLIHRDDAVAAICAALAAPPVAAGGIFNVVDDEPVRKQDLLLWLARKLGADSRARQPEAGEPARSAHRRNAGGATPNRRVSNTVLKTQLYWKSVYPSFRDGYQQILLDETKA